MTTLPATTIVTTTEDATVEGICFEYAWSVLKDVNKAAKLPGYVEATLDTNQGLAAKGTILPLGTRIALPEWTIDDERQTVRLWD